MSSQSKLAGHNSVVLLSLKNSPAATSSWWHLRCDVGLGEGEYLQNCLCIVYHYNVAQWYEQFFHVSQLDRALTLLGLALCLLSVSLVFMVLCIFEFVCYILYFTFCWAEPGGIGPWCGWLTVVLQCCDTVVWITWPIKLSQKWPVMCRVGC